MERDHEAEAKLIEADEKELIRRKQAHRAEEAKISIAKREIESAKRSFEHDIEAMRNVEDEVSTLKRERATDEQELDRLKVELRKQEIIIREHGGNHPTSRAA